MQTRTIIDRIEIEPQTGNVFVDDLLLYLDEDVAGLRLDFDTVYDGAGLHRQLLLIVDALNRFGRAARRYRVTGRFRAAPSRIIDRFFGGKDCFFVQVGSHDGVLRDPLHSLVIANPQWRGIFIEPLDEVFERLVANYPADRGLVFEQLAISHSNEAQSFYYVSRETMQKAGLPNTIQGVSSFSHDHVLTHLAGAKPYFGLTEEPEAYISCKSVACETLRSVLNRHHVDRVDLFVIDAETYDYEILRQIDFERLRPKVVLYEHAGLGPYASAATTLLREDGYSHVACGDLDTIAVRSYR